MMDSLISVVPPLLIVEDSNEDFEVFRRYVKRSPIKIPLLRCENGEDALAFLFRTGHYEDQVLNPLPSTIVLDLNLPLIDGREVLRRIKQDECLKSIPVVVFTTSNNPRDMEDCYQNGANRYIVKPIDFEQLKRDVETILNAWSDVTLGKQASSIV
jgi:CheY-like chemotaxis protein